MGKSGEKSWNIFWRFNTVGNVLELNLTRNKWADVDFSLQDRLAFSKKNKGEHLEMEQEEGHHSMPS